MFGKLIKSRVRRVSSFPSLMREILGLFLCRLHFICFAASVSAGESVPASLCRIEIVDKQSGWPVPLVELKTTHQIRFVSDNAGVIAFDLPELMGKEVWFDLHGHGYGVPKDGFGYSGVRLTPAPGRTLRVEVERYCLAKRVGRLTGAGLFGESQRLGEHLEWKESGIVGSDSAQCVQYHGGLFWLWGDTNVPRYPLGIFSCAGALSELSKEELRPPLRLPLQYAVDDSGRPRAVAPISGDGPTWIFGLTVMRDQDGSERIGGYYSKIRGFLSAYETGLAVWSDEKGVFERERVLWRETEGRPLPQTAPSGQSTVWRDASGEEWFLFGNPFPYLRCHANFEAWKDPRKWEKLSPQQQVTGLDGKVVVPHTGAIGFHPWRNRWVAVFVQKAGAPSDFGEVWYAEADQPTGPWGHTVKILSHDNYTFYNPRLHLEFTPEGKPWLYFEGTYTVLFSKNTTPTPRYDYNQILYRLDLDDPALDAVRSK